MISAGSTDGFRSELSKGQITITANELDANRFFLIERFLYRIVRP
jgi:hypothetical protein